jgi:RNA polymerase sigma-70 factor (ECF subfamily)
MNVAVTQECLGISESNVKVRLNRAKALLQESLSTYYNKDEIFHFHLSRCDKMVEKVREHIDGV